MWVTFSASGTEWVIKSFMWETTAVVKIEGLTHRTKITFCICLKLIKVFKASIIYRFSCLGVFENLSLP